MQRGCGKWQGAVKRSRRGRGIQLQVGRSGWSKQTMLLQAADYRLQIAKSSRWNQPPTFISSHSAGTTRLSSRQPGTIIPAATAHHTHARFPDDLRTLAILVYISTMIHVLSSQSTGPKQRPSICFSAGYYRWRNRDICEHHGQPIA